MNLLLTLLLLTTAAQADPWLVNARTHKFNTDQTPAWDNCGGTGIDVSELVPTPQGKTYKPPGVPKLPPLPKLPSLPKTPSLPKLPRVPKVPR